jgi:hypothetical protein
MSRKRQRPDDVYQGACELAQQLAAALEALKPTQRCEVLAFLPSLPMADPAPPPRRRDASRGSAAAMPELLKSLDERTLTVEEQLRMCVTECLVTGCSVRSLMERTKQGRDETFAPKQFQPGGHFADTK